MISSRKVHHLSWGKRLMLIPVYFLIRLWYATLRLKLSPEAQQCLNTFPSYPCVFYFWHCNLFVAPMLRKFRKKRPMYGLMSASKDGAWLESLVKKFHVEAIRGSSTWRGAQALKELDACANSACDIIITPDGPQGPCHQCKPGSLQWAQKQNCYIIFLYFDINRAWELHSWDQFRLPYPFSTIHITAHGIPPTSMSFEDLYKSAQQWL